ncbi:Transcription factor/nuclear export subunit protein 2 [Cryptosporidium felis]|nr:Transcription factor/nuclear export subunit protein 2 [Cryptosporidium felis]
MGLRTENITKSDETGSSQLNNDLVDPFCISNREYLPKEKCTISTWNNDIRIKLQYEFTNLLPVLFLSEDHCIVSRSQDNLQKIVFELLTSVLHYMDILHTTAIEFLENCSIVSYLKICKILGYEFIGRDELDVQEITINSMKSEFKELCSNHSNEMYDRLPPFKEFIKQYITPLIMDAVWLIQMNFNIENPNNNSHWLDFMVRLCRGNITSKERPLPSIPKSVKLASIEDIVSYLDLGKSDCMEFIEPLTSSKFKLQQKYVRDRTRLCFAVDSFSTQKECLNGFSTLAILIKYYFDQVNNNIDNFSAADIESKNISSSGTNLHEEKPSIINNIWDAIVRFDLSIQRSIGIIFEVFISNHSDQDVNKSIVLLENLLSLFPKNIIRKSFIIFIEYLSKLYNSKELSIVEYNVTMGSETYRKTPWLIANQREFKGTLNYPFFILTAFLIKNNLLEFNDYFKKKLIEWDNTFWSSFITNENQFQEIHLLSTFTEELNPSYFPPRSIAIIKRIYQYYHMYYDSHFSEVIQFEKDPNLELLLKGILKNEKNYDEISFKNISLVLSELILAPSIYFANAFFEYKQNESLIKKSSETYYLSKMSNNFEILNELCILTSMPFSIIDLSSNILKSKFELIITEIKNDLIEDKKTPREIILYYKQFYLLIEWVEKYCKYYLFQKYPNCISTLLELIGIFIKECEKNQLFSYSNKNECSKLNGLRDPLELFCDILSTIVFPAISLLPKSPAVPEMLKNSIFSEIDIKYRYRIYRRLITSSYNCYPMNYQWISVKRILSKHLKGVTKDIMVNRNGNLQRKPSIQVRLLISNIVSLSYTNPLVVCDTIINQCNNYDNMIPLFVEILGSNIDELCFDIMIFSIINFILSRSISTLDCRSKNKDLNGSRLSYRGIAKFSALLFTKRKVQRDIFNMFLQTIIYRIDETFQGNEYTNKISNNFLDLCFWKQLLEIVFSTPTLDLSVLTGRQIKSLAGGPLFQQYLSQHGDINTETTNGNSFYNSLIDANSHEKQNSDLFVSILKSGEIQGKDILFRIAKLRNEILWDSPSNYNMDIKLLVNLSDEIHWCCIQTIELLKRSFDTETYKCYILNASNANYNFKDIIYQTFSYLDTPTGWSFLRHGIRKTKGFSDNSSISDSDLFDIESEVLGYLRSYIPEEKEYRSFFNDEVCVDFYILFWYLDLCDIALPYKQYSETLFNIYNEICDCKRSIDKILFQNVNDYKIESNIEKYDVGSFLDPKNIKPLSNCLKNKNNVPRHVRDSIKPFERKFKRLYSFYNALTGEYLRYSKRSDYISNYLDSDYGVNKFRERLKKYFNPTSTCNRNKNCSFMLWICKEFIAPRVIQSEMDALFTFRWIEILILDSKKGIFADNEELIIQFLILISKYVSSLIRSSTPRESQLLGLFFNELFSFIKNSDCEAKLANKSDQDENKQHETIYTKQSNNPNHESEFGKKLSNSNNSNVAVCEEEVAMEQTEINEKSLGTKLNSHEVDESSRVEIIGKDCKLEFTQNLSPKSICKDGSNHVDISLTANERKIIPVFNAENNEASLTEGNIKAILDVPRGICRLVPINLFYECERNIMISLSLGLGLLTGKPIEIYPEWIDTLSSVWMLLRCYEAFPISSLTGELLLKTLPNILQHATKRQWNDLNLSITSLILKLKQQKTSWIENSQAVKKNMVNAETSKSCTKFQNELVPKKNSSSSFYSSSFLNNSSKTTEDKCKTSYSRSDTKRQRLNEVLALSSQKSGDSIQQSHNRKSKEK